MTHPTYTCMRVEYILHPCLISTVTIFMKLVKFNSYKLSQIKHYIPETMILMQDRLCTNCLIFLTCLMGNLK